MPDSIWDTSLPQSDVDLYTSAVDEESWKALIYPHFFDNENDWDDFWSDRGNTLETAFNYQNNFGANESLTRRSFSKGLDLLRSNAYGKMNTQAKNRANVGFAGAGGGLGLYKGAPSLWNDYQMSLQENKNTMIGQLQGYGQQHKSAVDDYLQSLAAAGEFTFG